MQWEWPKVIKQWPPSLRANVHYRGRAQFSAEMENTCVVFGSKNQGSKGEISFFSFPVDE